MTCSKTSIFSPLARKILYSTNWKQICYYSLSFIIQGYYGFSLKLEVQAVKILIRSDGDGNTEGE
jgi:hypothetical protein